MKDAIKAKALEIGFDAVGFCSADADPRDAENLRTYLAEGRQGSMTWMAETEQRRTSPQGLWPEARSVVVLGQNYAPREDARKLLDHPERANVSVYARNRDYHDLVKKRLKALARWMVAELGGELKVFVDTAPVMESPLAMRAGLGWLGKHTNLVSREFGSWLCLGEIYTTLELPPDPPGRDRCGTCVACLAACPTGAITEPRKLDARLCISYLTIEHHGEIAPDLAGQMGNRVYGCDDCMAACPWNRFAPATTEDWFLPRIELTAPELADFLELDDAAFREIFSGSPVKRIKRERFLRNVLIAIANSGGAAMAEKIRPLLDDPSELVRTEAARCLDRLEEEHG